MAPRTVRPFGEARFRAMGTDVHVVVVAPKQTDAQRLVARATDRVDHLERLWSRFDAASEVSEINRNAGEWVGVSPETMRLVGT
ncbi:MAG: FAD:protein FMN transferase, partial [Acidimicrobiales bacterium]|nr:FAD:protein FMN transferase [Acidimicrobiales bacterium]